MNLVIVKMKMKMKMKMKKDDDENENEKSTDTILMRLKFAEKQIVAFEQEPVSSDKAKELFQYYLDQDDAENHPACAGILSRKFVRIDLCWF